MVRLFVLSLLALAASATTLQKLSLDEMIAKSTEIVRGKVTGSSAAFRNANRTGMIYTHYTISVSERYKGSGSTTLDVVVPGGVANGYRQVFAGTPTLNTGDEYVFLLWTSRNGLTQILGLTQGLFTLAGNLDGKQVLSRSAGPETMVNPATGEVVIDSGMTVTLDEIKRRIATQARAGL